MENSITKGEWFPVVISTITIGVNAVINKEAAGTYSQSVCEFMLPDTDEEYEKIREEIEANARLIVQAPRLLEICKEALRMYESVQPAGGWQGVYDELKSVIKDSSV